MKEDKLEKVIKQTLKEDEDLLEYIDDIDIPDFEETMNEFKQNLEKPQEIKKSSVKSKNFKMKFSYKKLSAVAAVFILAVGFPILHHFNSLNNNMNLNENPGVQCPNPLTEGKSEEEVEKICGFHVEKVKYIPKGYEKEAIIYIDITEKDKLVRQIFMDKNDGKIDFEKYKEKYDITSDYNKYDNEEKITINNNKITLYYRENQLYKAVWNQNGFVYDILSSKSIEKEEMIKMIESIIIK